MGHGFTEVSEREERRDRVLLAYVEAIEEGREPDRGAFLAAHPDLREDLETFLAGHDEIARLTAPLREASAGTLSSIGELGDFRLLREVGRGGMGVVYEAEQVSLRRRVALKVLPFAAAIDPRRLQRFKTEALAAAHVQHEQIVPVYAVGCERGVHYYAMQFIEGQSLAALVGELRRLRDEPDRRTSPPPGWQGDMPAVAEIHAGRSEVRPEGPAIPAATSLSRERSTDRRRYFDRVAELGRQAATALEHAHQAGIVHRDIKPGNLLLDLRGQLWMTDFGLAQVTGDAGLTVTGELLGTLRYSSPEQLLARRGIVDHRSDVYSLGATLYELLALRPPFDGRDRNALIRQIADDDPPSLGALDRTIPADLETIVLKTLRKEPGDRYGRAQELADDLRRFLDRRPILARRPRPAERLRNWARRHPSLVGAGVVGLILLSAASLVSTILVRREQGKTLVAQRRAESAYRRERLRAEEAEARFRLARRTVDELIRMSEEELAHRPGMEGLRKRLLASALASYREFIEQRRSEPGAQLELRDTTRRVETILADLAVLHAAGELYLLAQPAALDDLRLDEAQRARVAELSARSRRNYLETFGDPQRLPPPTRRRQLALEQARSNEAEVHAILTATQRLRLRQLALQSEGPSAFRDPDVVLTLELTPAQRERLRAIEEEIRFGQSRALPSGGESGSAGKPQTPSAVERILAELTAEQSRRWREMAGEPIRGSLIAFPSRSGSPRSPRRAPR